MILAGLFLSGCTSVLLQTRKYQVHPGFLNPSDMRAGVAGDFVDMNQNHYNSKEEELTSFLVNVGVAMPPGSSITIDTNNYTMTAINTPKNLDLIERVLVPLGEGWLIKRIK